MSDHTAIEWSDATWNPVRGCTKVSFGCKYCYAETFAERFRGVKGHAYEQGFDLRLVPEALDLPLRWKTPRRVFVNSMSDLFHENVPSGFIAKVFATMAQAPQHTFQILTKRAERMEAWILDAAMYMGHLYLPGRGAIWPLPNVWLGVSCEDQAAADERIPHLLATPAAVRFVSAEPLLSQIDLLSSGTLSGLDWLIVGGESGPKARPCDAAWVRDIVRQCRGAGVPCFVKQLGSQARLHDRKGGDLAEWPEDLRVRQMPARSTNVPQDRRRNRR